MVEILISVMLTFIVVLGLFALGLIALVGEGGGWSAWPIVLLFFLAIWTGGLWLTPVGPPLVGIYWMPFVFVALFIALFWAAAPPPPSRGRRTGVSSNVQTTQQEEPSATAAGLGVLFWMLLGGLAIAGLARYAASLGPVVRG